jgi:hypothetical protein
MEPFRFDPYQFSGMWANGYVRSIQADIANQRGWIAQIQRLAVLTAARTAQAQVFFAGLISLVVETRSGKRGSRERIRNAIK